MKDFFENYCEVVRDLLPLYADGGCTEKTNRLIKEHLRYCDDCKQYLKSVKNPGKKVFDGDIPYSDPDYSAVVSKLRRRKIIKRSLLLTALIVGAAADAVILLSRHD